MLYEILWRVDLDMCYAILESIEIISISDIDGIEYFAS